MRARQLITAEGLDEIRAMGFPVYPGALGKLTQLRLRRREIADASSRRPRFR